MKQFSADDIKQLMSISDELAELNESRYQDWCSNTKGGRQAMLAFKGGVYFGLEAWTLNERDFTSAQRRLRILSGLYGVLKPMDMIHPYRLEMGLPINNQSGSDLYAFWQSKVTEELNQDLASHRNQVLVNLASDEYFKVIDKQQLNHRVVQCQFLDKFRDGYRFMSFYGKKARGLMARHIITNKIDNVAGLKRFDLEGYRFDQSRSLKDKLVFIRDEPPKPA